MWVAIIQTQSTGELEFNCQRAHHLIAEAASRGAKFVALPEYCLGLGPPEAIVRQRQAVAGPVVQGFCQQARELGLYLLLGTIPEEAPVPGKVYNTSLLINPAGGIQARYRKIHLFDINIPGKVTFQESAHIMPGDEIVAVPLADEGWTVGLAICYDLRFPELFRALVDRGADLIVVPAAFSQVTGRDHWEVLLRARAIENQVYVLAPAQYPHPEQSIKTYGRSVIIDPWGLVLAKAADREDIIYARLDHQHLQKIRSELPCLAHRRLPPAS